jgi:type IV secretion system protein VirB11
MNTHIAKQIWMHLRPFHQWLDDKDAGIEEIAVQQKYQECWLYQNNNWYCVPCPEINEQWMKSLHTITANYVGQQQVSLLSATLPSGERLQIVAPPYADPTYSLTLRLPDRNRLTLDQILDYGTFSPVANTLDMSPYEYLKDIISTKKNILISGATGSGKTTLTRALMDMVPDNERLITIEDSRELFLRQPLTVSMLFDRNLNAEVSPRELFQSTLRMRPDRILLAEVRGAEAYEYLSAVMSGHNGSITSLHAGDSEQALIRLTSMYRESQTGQGMEFLQVKELITSIIDVVFQMENKLVTEIYRVPK